MVCPTIGMSRLINVIGQGSMDGTALVRVGTGVDRRADQRVPELDPGTGHEDLTPIGFRLCVGTAPKVERHSSDQRSISRGLRGGNEEKQARLGGERTYLLEKMILQSTTDRERMFERSPA